MTNILQRNLESPRQNPPFMHDHSKCHLNPNTAVTCIEIESIVVFLQGKSPTKKGIRRSVGVYAQSAVAQLRPSNCSTFRPSGIWKRAFLLSPITPVHLFQRTETWIIGHMQPGNSDQKSGNVQKSKSIHF
jgi:hypothetical protein